MQNVLKVRKNIFDKMLEYGDNRKNWEMLCCSDKPLVPFIGRVSRNGAIRCGENY